MNKILIIQSQKLTSFICNTLKKSDLVRNITAGNCNNKSILSLTEDEADKDPELEADGWAEEECEEEEVEEDMVHDVEAADEVHVVDDEVDGTDEDIFGKVADDDDDDSFNDVGLVTEAEFSEGSLKNEYIKYAKIHFTVIKKKEKKELSSWYIYVQIQ